MRTLEIPMNVRVRMDKKTIKGGSSFEIGKLTMSTSLKITPKFIMYAYASMRLFFMAVKSLYEKESQ